MKDEIKHAQLNKEKWDKWSGSYDSKNWQNDYLRNLQNKLISSLDIKENINFLDIGCGTGFAVGKVAKSANFKGNFYGIDLSKKMIEKAKANFANHNNFHFLEANAEKIPLENNFFDIIICTNSFHHYLHPQKAVDEMQHLLKNGGKVYILDITLEGWLGFFVNKVHKLFEPEQVKLYSTKEFRQMIEKAGLKYLGSKKIKIGSKVNIGEK